METATNSDEQIMPRSHVYTTLAKKMFELRIEKKKLEEKVNEIDAALDQIRFDLTKIMEDLQMQKFSLDHIGTFYLATSVFPKIGDSDRLVQWLDENKLSNIAPRKIHIPSLKEMIETRLENDEMIPSQDLVEMATETNVRLRIAKGA